MYVLFIHVYVICMWRNLEKIEFLKTARCISCKDLARCKKHLNITIVPNLHIGIFLICMNVFLRV